MIPTLRYRGLRVLVEESKLMCSYCGVQLTYVNRGVRTRGLGVNVDTTCMYFVFNRSYIEVCDGDDAEFPLL
jgi:hypothetical protein